MAAVIGVCLFAQAFVRLRRRGRADHAPWTRPLVFGAAVAIGLFALLSPLDEVAEEQLLSAHMLQHVLIGDLVPALLLVAVRGPLVLFLIPPAPLRGLARVRPLRATLSVLLRPLVSFAVWAGGLAVWHVPAVYDAVLTRPLLHDLEHATFFLGGLLVWAQLVDPARRGALGPNAKLGYALALFACGTAFSNVLLLRFDPLYPAYGSLGDQRAAAFTMMLEQLLTLGTFAAVMLRARAREPLALAADRHPVAL